MSLFIGGKKVGAMFIGGKPVAVAYKGGEVIFRKSAPVVEFPSALMPDGKIWMTKNLDITTLNGNEIGTYYNNDPIYGEVYGRLYTWQEAVNVAASVQGWHLPTREEWGALAIAAGGTGTYGDVGTVGKKLKAKSGWKNNGNGTDEYGFTALPGGDRSTDGNFGNAGNLGYWWTATEYDADIAYYRDMGYNYDRMYENYSLKGSGMSVRLMKD
jgi:uncharacterized protein (TIGR02145 family)